MAPPTSPDLDTTRAHRSIRPTLSTAAARNSASLSPRCASKQAAPHPAREGRVTMQESVSLPVFNQAAAVAEGLSQRRDGGVLQAARTRHLACVDRVRRLADHVHELEAENKDLRSTKEDMLAKYACLIMRVKQLEEALRPSRQPLRVTPNSCSARRPRAQCSGGGGESTAGATDIPQ